MKIFPQNLKAAAAVCAVWMLTSACFAVELECSFTNANGGSDGVAVFNTDDAGWAVSPREYTFKNYDYNKTKTLRIYRNTGTAVLERNFDGNILVQSSGTCQLLSAKPKF